MSGESHLDNRLRLCAAFVREGSKLADIGTDHAYLPVWLCRNGICPSAIAADINPDPLKRGQATIAQAELGDRIETRLSDGLAAIGENEADDIVIAGMGGELIAKILGNCPYAKNPDKHFILQPMSKSEVLIRFLCNEGFTILSQDCCEAAGKCYTVLSVAFTRQTIPCDDIFPYIGKLDPTKHKTHLRFVKGHIDRLKKKSIGDARFGAIAKRLEDLCDNG